MSKRNTLVCADNKIIIVELWNGQLNCDSIMCDEWNCVCAGIVTVIRAIFVISSVSEITSSKWCLDDFMTPVQRNTIKTPTIFRSWFAKQLKCNRVLKAKECALCAQHVNSLRATECKPKIGPTRNFITSADCTQTDVWSNHFTTGKTIPGISVLFQSKQKGTAKHQWML